jgi:hypothetical protein
MANPSTMVRRLKKNHQFGIVDSGSKPDVAGSLAVFAGSYPQHSATWAAKLGHELIGVRASSSSLP